MQEILSARSYTRKVFDLENGKKLFRFHSAHKHYKNSIGQFLDIDCSLSFDDVEKTWKHGKASYYPAIPEYADGEFDFHNLYEGADHHIKVRPVASHVQGVMTKDGEGNYVFYKDAFGVGMHLKVYAYNHGLKKVIIIDKKPAEALIFDFEITNYADLAFKTSTDSAINVSSLSAEFSFKDSTIKLGSNFKYSYFRNALMWDSGGLEEKVEISLIKDGTKLLIRKTIPKTFLDEATFPVYTDHPTNYAPPAGDGNVIHGSGGESSSNWDACHDATSGGSASYTGTTAAARSGVKDDDQNKFRIERAFVPIDTSGIDDGATISSASLYIYVTAKEDDHNDSYSYVTVVQTDQPSTTELTTSDYNNCGATDDPTEGVDSGNRLDATAANTSAYNSFALNATGISYISKTGISMFGIREGHDVQDEVVPNTWGYNTRITFSTSEDTSGTQDPYLDVTVGAAETNVNATAISVTSSVKTPQIQVGIEKTVSVVAGQLSIPTPQCNAGTTENATVNVNSIHGTLTIPTPQEESGVQLSVSVIPVNGSIIKPTCLSGLTATPEVISMTGSIPAITIQIDESVYVSAIILSGEIISAELQSGVVKSITAIPLLLSVKTPVILTDNMELAATMKSRITKTISENSTRNSDEQDSHITKTISESSEII